MLRHSFNSLLHSSGPEDIPEGGLTLKKPLEKPQPESESSSSSEEEEEEAKSAPGGKRKRSEKDSSSAVVTSPGGKVFNPFCQK